MNGGKIPDRDPRRERLLRGRVPGNLPRWGLALILGGALGNLADRLIRGYVPDMIETLFISFPIFNVADICITVGCALVMVSLLFRPGDWRFEGTH